VGTNNEDFLKDPLYIGQREKRLRGEAYDSLIEEFIQAVLKVFPGVLLQFEDFGNSNAFRLLEKYRDQLCTFNDDIQGTGSVALAGVLSALRITGGRMSDHRVLLLGAGEAGMGIADNIVAVLMEEGLSLAEARKRIWFVDSKGLIVKGREGLVAHKLHYAHDHAPCADLLSAVKDIKPTMLIGVSGQARAFTEEIIKLMSGFNKRPVIFALSNPTSKAECTAEEAYKWTEGRAIFASGSPFAPVTLNGKMYVPGQGNNAYIFPGVGLGVVATGAKRVTDSMFVTAAKALAALLREEELAEGRIYPALRRINEVSLKIAVAVAEEVFASKLTDQSRPADLTEFVAAHMFKPEYLDYSHR
jgi:malate dehydrogenase (oxaloacetate-decarboxylating)(NADP+)